jgi:IS30 family transposase
MERFILYGALLIAGYFVIYLILKARLKKSMDPKSVLASIREEIDRIIVELNSTTDRNITLMEDKVQVLTELLDRADRKIGVLKREIEKHEMSGKVYSELAAHAQQTQHAQKAEKQNQEPVEEDLRTQVLNLHGEGISASAIAKRLGITLAAIDLILSLAKVEDG